MMSMNLILRRRLVRHDQYETLAEKDMLAMKIDKVDVLKVAIMAQKSLQLLNL